MSDCEWFTQIAQEKFAAVSESLRSLMTKEQPWANCSGRSWLKINKRNAQFFERIVAHKKWANEQIARFYSESLICSFFRITRSDSLRKRCKNSKPWFLVQFLSNSFLLKLIIGGPHPSCWTLWPKVIIPWLLPDLFWPDVTTVFFC